MAAREPLLHFLSQLWQEVGFARSGLLDDSGNPVISLDQAVAYIKDQLAEDILPVGEANVIQARLRSFEGEVNRIAAHSNLPRSELHTAIPRPTFPIAMETAGLRARSALPPDTGSPAFFHTPIVPEAPRLITSADLPPMPDNFMSELHRWTNTVDESLLARGVALDPFVVEAGKLPWQQREPLLNRFDEMIGGAHLRNIGMGPTFVSDIDAPNAVAQYRMSVDPNDLRTIYLARNSYQYRNRPLGQAERAYDLYHPSGRQLRPEVAEHTANVLREHLGKSGKTLVFDVESAGLDPAGGIWQLAAHMIDENGKMIGDPRTFYFHNAEMQWKGEMGRTRQSLEQFLTKGETVRDFPEGLKDFFKMVEESDYVAGHNIFFDYGMISRGLRIKAAQLKDAEFTHGVNTFISKFINEDTGEIGRVIDTNVLAQMRMANLSLAPELKAAGVYQRFSLENILLQSNLLERVRAAEGDKTVNAWMKRGMHFADVDVPIERHLLTALREMETGNGPGLQFETENVAGHWLAGSDRFAISHSGAITPLTFLRDFEKQVNDDLVPQMLKSGIIEFDPERLRAAGFESRESVLAYVEEQAAKGISAKQAMLNRKLQTTISKIRMNPMEQMISASRDFAQPIEERAFLTPLPGYRETFKNAQGALWRRLKSTFWDKPQFPDRSMAEMAYRAGTWNRISQGWVTKEGHITRRPGMVPGPSEWATIQDQLAEAGIPFSHSSLIERNLMAQIGTSMGPGLASGVEGTVRRLYGADVASMGRWMGTDKLLVRKTGDNMIARIPIADLIQAEKAGVFNKIGTDAPRTGFMAATRGEAPEMFVASPFKYDAAGREQHEIGVMFRFAEEAEQGELERKRLLNFLRNKYGDTENPEIFEQLREAFDPSNRFGIQIATFGGVGDKLKNQSQASRLFHVMTGVTGANVERGAENTAEIRMAYAPLPGEELGGPIVHTVGSFIKHQMLGEEQMEGIGYHARQTVRLYTQAMDQVKDSKTMAYISQLATRPGEMDRGMKLAYGYMTVKKRAPLLALGAAVMGGIGWKIHKNRETRLSDQSLAPMDIENEDWYDDYQNDLATSSRPINYQQARTPNPLTTAGLMKTLDRRKTNHTNMSSDRYGYLFSKGYS